MSEAFNPLVASERARKAGQYAVLGAERPLKLDCGAELGPFTVAYQTYGRLNAAGSNVVLACHALTGDQYVAGTHPVTGKPGWWSWWSAPGASSIPSAIS